MSKPFSPLLAAETPVFADGSLNAGYFEERMPWLASFKYDGIRAVKLPSFEGRLISRTIKPFPSAYVHKTFGLESLNGLDGELLVPKQHGPTIYHDTYSAVMTQGCTDPVNWLVFDYIDGHWSYDARHDRLKEIVAGHSDVPGLILVEQKLVTTVQEMLDYEEIALQMGHEGLVLRSPQSPYKYGRSTEKQGWLVKLARKVRFEAVVEDMIEMMHNDNEAIVDPRGYTVRSSHKANLRPAGMCGTLILRDVKTGVVFGCGTGKGFDQALRKDIFDNWPRDKGKIVTVESKPYGSKDAPRQPSLLAGDLVGWRHPIDMSEPKEAA